MAQANGSEQLFKPYGLIHFFYDMTTAAPSFEPEFVLRECASLITKQIVYLAKVFVQVKVLRAAVKKLVGFIGI